MTRSIAAKDAPPQLSLAQILNAVKENNPALKACLLQASGTPASAPAMPDPTVSIGSFLTPYPGQNTGANGYASLSVEQSFPIPGLHARQKAYLQAQNKAAQCTPNIFINELNAQARKAFYTWHIANKKLQYLKNELKLLQRIKKAERKKEAIESEFGSLHKAEAYIQELTSQITFAEGDTDRMRYALNALMGQDIHFVFSIPKNPPKEALYNAEDFQANNLKYYREDLRQMEAQTEAVRLWMDYRNKTLLPHFTVGLTHFFPLSPEAQRFSLLFSMKVPLFSRKAAHRRIKQQGSHQIKALQLEKTHRISQTLHKLYDLETQIDITKNRITVLERSVLAELKKVFNHNFALYRDENLQLYILLDDWYRLYTMTLSLWEERLKLFLFITDFQKEIFK